MSVIHIHKNMCKSPMCVYEIPKAYIFVRQIELCFRFNNNYLTIVVLLQIYCELTIV